MTKPELTKDDLDTCLGAFMALPIGNTYGKRIEAAARALADRLWSRWEAEHQSNSFTQGVAVGEAVGERLKAKDAARDGASIDALSKEWSAVASDMDVLCGTQPQPVGPLTATDEIVLAAGLEYHGEGYGVTNAMRRSINAALDVAPWVDGAQEIERLNNGWKEANAKAFDLNSRITELEFQLKSEADRHDKTAKLLADALKRVAELDEQEAAISQAIGTTRYMDLPEDCHPPLENGLTKTALSREVPA